MDQKDNFTNTKSLQWFVLKTNPQAEKKVYDRLIKADIKSFLPLYETIRQWSDRKKKINIPLIPSVVFIQCNAHELTKTFTIPGMNGILHYLGKPAIVKEHEIENIRILLKEWNNITIYTEAENIIEGVCVEVVKGPFKGLIATSLSMNGKNRILVHIESLGSNFVVNVPRSFLKKLNKVAD